MAVAQLKVEAAVRNGCKLIFVPKDNVDKEGFLVSVDHTGTERVQTDVDVPADVLVLACDNVITVFDLLHIASGEGERGLPRTICLEYNFGTLMCLPLDALDRDGTRIFCKYRSVVDSL